MSVSGGKMMMVGGRAKGKKIANAYSESTLNKPSSSSSSHPSNMSASMATLSDIASSSSSSSSTTSLFDTKNNESNADLFVNNNEQKFDQTPYNDRNHSCTRSFISFIHSFIRPFVDFHCVHSFIHSFVHPSIHPSLLFIHFRTHSRRSWNGVDRR